MDRTCAFDLSVDAAFEFKMNGSGNGQPIAGDWDGDGSDEVAALKGNSWFIDDTGNDLYPGVNEHQSHANRDQHARLACRG